MADVATYGAATANGDVFTGSNAALEHLAKRLWTPGAAAAAAAATQRQWTAVNWPLATAMGPTGVPSSSSPLLIPWNAALPADTTALLVRLEVKRRLSLGDEVLVHPVVAGVYNTTLMPGAWNWVETGRLVTDNYWIPLNAVCPVFDTSAGLRLFVNHQTFQADMNVTATVHAYM